MEYLRNPYESKIYSVCQLVNVYLSNREDKIQPTCCMGSRKISASGNFNGKCWLCRGQNSQCDVIYPKNKGDKVSYCFCVRCAASILCHIICPEIDSFGIFRSVEENMVAAVTRVLHNDKMGNISIPSHSDNEGEPSEWECLKCKENISRANSMSQGVSEESTRLLILPCPVQVTYTKRYPSSCKWCPACGTPKPESPICNMCSRNYNTSPLCHYTKKMHNIWTCSECNENNLDSMDRCRLCRKPQTWFCALCSLENPISARSCRICQNVEMVSSLNSFDNREKIKEFGLDVNQQLRELKMSEEVRENKYRLQYRIQQLHLADATPTKDDGNCLFRAISFQILRSESFYNAVRFLVVDFLRKNAKEFQKYIGEEEDLTNDSKMTQQRNGSAGTHKYSNSPEIANRATCSRAFEEYVSKMAEDRTWGDEICVMAASKALGVSIHLITSNERKWHLEYKSNMSSRHLLLSYLKPLHFGCLRLQSFDPISPFVDIEGCLNKLCVKNRMR
eukprot:Tbor_TRINITY_DN5199_c0_g1::TRINITY_DN5199_c0_g1_i1::g.26051::m.26051